MYKMLGNQTVDVPHLLTKYFFIAMEVNGYRLSGHKHYCVQQKKVWKIADDRIGFFGRTSALKQLYVVMFSIFKLNHSDK